MTFQAMGAFTIGSLAQFTWAPWAMTGAGLGSVVVTALLWRRAHGRQE